MKDHEARQRSRSELVVAAARPAAACGVPDFGAGPRRRRRSVRRRHREPVHTPVIVIAGGGTSTEGRRHERRASATRGARKERGCFPGRASRACSRACAATRGDDRGRRRHTVGIRTASCPRVSISVQKRRSSGAQGIRSHRPAHARRTRRRAAAHRWRHDSATHQSRYDRRSRARLRDDGYDRAHLETKQPRLTRASRGFSQTLISSGRPIRNARLGHAAAGELCGDLLAKLGGMLAHAFERDIGIDVVARRDQSHLHA